MTTSNGWNRARVVVMRNGMPSQYLPVTGGRITVDATAATRRTLDVDVLGRIDLIPNAPHHILDGRAPTMELRAEIGKVDDDLGEQWWVPQGIFRVRSTRIKRDGGGTTELSVSGADRAARPRWMLMGGVVIAGGTSLESAIATVLASGRTPVEWEPNTATGVYLPTCVLGELGDDRLELCQKLAETMGWRLVYDRSGRLVLVKVPLINPTSEPVRTFASAQQTSTRLDAFNPSYESPTLITSSLRSVERSLDMGDAADGLVLHFNGELLVYPDEFVTYPAMFEGDTTLFMTRQRAWEAMAAQYARGIGQAEQVQFTAVCDPQVEVDDIVRVIDHSTQTDVTGAVTGLGFVLGENTMEVRLAVQRKNEYTPIPTTKA